MTGEGVITAHLEDEEITRVDALAQRRGIGRDAMLIELVRTGLSTCEKTREIEGKSQGI